MHSQDQQQLGASLKPKKMSAKPTSIINYAYNCTHIAQRFEHSFGYDLLFRARTSSSSPFFYEITKKELLLWKLNEFNHF